MAAPSGRGARDLAPAPACAPEPGASAQESAPRGPSDRASGHRGVNIRLSRLSGRFATGLINHGLFGAPLWSTEEGAEAHSSRSSWSCRVVRLKLLFDTALSVVHDIRGMQGKESIKAPCMKRVARGSFSQLRAP